MDIKFKRIRPVKMPTRGTPGSAGIDFYVPNDARRIEIQSSPDEVSGGVLIPSGIIAEIPKGHALVAFNKSGVARNNVIVGACVIDEDYQGEITLHVINVDPYNSYLIDPGDKLVQFLLLPVAYPNIVEVEKIHTQPTERGSGGFGSTGTI